MNPIWYVTKDGDVSCLELYERHYSCNRYADGRKRSQFVGPGEHVVLRTGDADAMFVWRKFISQSGELGVNCAVFRNESKHQSSALILEAERLAWARWPGARLYTYVNAKKVKSVNPGFCYKSANWKVCGVTKKLKLIILEKLPS